jgi:tetratricopeptide (TPR) repeat protein
MRYLLLAFSLWTIILNAQPVLNFNKHNVECEDQWVIFPMTKDSSYIYGFIYIDHQAGLTFNYEGNFKIASDGKYIPKKDESHSFKVRLQPNAVLLSIVPESKYQELKIKATPDWLRFYKTDTTSVTHLYRWGFLYNGWNMCNKALTYLESAQKIDPHFKGLAVELAFSYNCIGKYSQALIVLENALKDNPTDAYINKELIYAQVKGGLLDQAAESCKNAIRTCEDKTYNGENCINLLQAYYIRKDKTNFNLWLDETKKWTADKANMIGYIKQMETKMKE